MNFSCILASCRQIQAIHRDKEHTYCSVHVESELEDDGFTDQDLETAILNGEIVRRERDNIGRSSMSSKAPPGWTRTHRRGATIPDSPAHCYCDSL